MSATAIAPKLCECGCGNVTPIARFNHTRNRTVKGQHTRFCLHHRKPARTKVNYVKVRTLGHPRAARGTHCVNEHILIVERALGHTLQKGHPVHHVDSDRTNNANRNLVVCEDDAYHNLLHRRARAFKACGNADYRRCPFCKTYSDPATMKGGTGRQAYYHAACKVAWKAKMKVA